MTDMRRVGAFPGPRSVKHPKDLTPLISVLFPLLEASTKQPKPLLTDFLRTAQGEHEAALVANAARAMLTAK